MHAQNTAAVDYIALIKVNAVKASRDTTFSEDLYFTEDVISFAMGALNAGFNIICDTASIKEKLHKVPMIKLGTAAHCFIGEQEVLRKSGNNASLRAALAIEYAQNLNKPLIFVIGNTPQALMRLNELTAEKILLPKLVIATPVGYSDAVESKQRLVESGVPSIVSMGMKGGTDAAAAIMNTLLDLAAPSRI